MATCTSLLLTISIVLLTSNGIYAKSIDDNGDYFLNLFGQQTEQRQREHNAYWDEQGRKHAEYWKNFWPNAVDILVKVPAAVINGVTTIMTAVSAMQPLLNLGGGSAGAGPAGTPHPATIATRPPPTIPRPSRPSTAEPRPGPVSSDSDNYSDEGSGPNQPPSGPSTAEPELIVDDNDDDDDYDYDDDYDDDDDDYDYASDESEEHEGSA